MLTAVEKCSFVVVGVPGVYRSSRNAQNTIDKIQFIINNGKKTVLIIISSNSISIIYATYACAQLCRISRVKCLGKMFVSEFSDTTKMLHMHHKNLFGGEHSSATYDSELSIGQPIHSHSLCIMDA